MTITTPPAGLPALTTNAGGIELDRLAARADAHDAGIARIAGVAQRRGPAAPSDVVQSLGGLNARRTRRRPVPQWGRFARAAPCRWSNCAVQSDRPVTPHHRRRWR